MNDIKLKKYGDSNMNLITMLETLPDFRRKQGQRYPLSVIMLITIMSIMVDGIDIEKLPPLQRQIKKSC